jgi:hypothetical protein
VGKMGPKLEMMSYSKEGAQQGQNLALELAARPTVVA